MTEMERLELEKRYTLLGISARIKNAATLAVNANLTPAGTALCNGLSHVIKAMYDQALTLKDPVERDTLLNAIQAQEQQPANIISALKDGIMAEKAAARKALRDAKIEQDAKIAANMEYQAKLAAAKYEAEMAYNAMLDATWELEKRIRYEKASLLRSISGWIKRLWLRITP